MKLNKSKYFFIVCYLYDSKGNLIKNLKVPTKTESGGYPNQHVLRQNIVNQYKEQLGVHWVEFGAREQVSKKEYQDWVVVPEWLEEAIKAEKSRAEMEAKIKAELAASNGKRQAKATPTKGKN